MLTKDPFTTAERYIQLRTLCHSPSWGDTAIRANEMIVAPLIALYCLFTWELDFFMMGSAAMTAHRAWSEWFEFTDLQFEIQRMKLYTLVSGGPHIVTNDPTYMPYVYADAVVRLNTRCLA
jgi:hypothetical protein